MNRLYDTRQRQSAAIAHAAFVDPVTRDFLTAPGTSNPFADGATSGEIERIPVYPTIDLNDPLTRLAIEHGIEVVPGDSCPLCGEGVGKATCDGDPMLACLGVLVPVEWQTCNWSRWDDGREF